MLVTGAVVGVGSVEVAGPVGFTGADVEPVGDGWGVCVGATEGATTLVGLGGGAVVVVLVDGSTFAPLGLSSVPQLRETRPPNKQANVNSKTYFGFMESLY